MQKTLKKSIKAIFKYNMIQEGDKVAIGLSGGKDSLLLLTLLARYKKFADYNFDIIAITIDLGMGNTDFAGLKAFCEENDVPLHIVKSNIYKIVFEERKEKSPCSLCAKMRRGILCSTAAEMGFNKVALGHHADDLNETLFLSMIYEGRLNTFKPVSFMSNTGITVIRPLIFVDEETIIKLTRDFPVCKNPCPANNNTRREYVKDLLKKIHKEVPCSHLNIKNAITHPERTSLWKTENPE